MTVPSDARLYTLDEIKALPPSEFPKMVLSNGYTSTLGYLISILTPSHDFWTHFMWQVSPFEVITQWWYLRRQSIDDFSMHSLKYWDGNWNNAERQTITQILNQQVNQGKWATRYDVVGLIGKAFGLNVKNAINFCSERFLINGLLDPACLKWTQENPSPRPEEVNAFLKTQPRYRVFGRVQPG